MHVTNGSNPIQTTSDKSHPVTDFLTVFLHHYGYEIHKKTKVKWKWDINHALHCETNMTLCLTPLILCCLALPCLVLCCVACIVVGLIDCPLKALPLHKNRAKENVVGLLEYMSMSPFMQSLCWCGEKACGMEWIRMLLALFPHSWDRRWDMNGGGLDLGPSVSLSLNSSLLTIYSRITCTVRLSPHLTMETEISLLSIIKLLQQYHAILHCAWGAGLKEQFPLCGVSLPQPFQTGSFRPKNPQRDVLIKTGSMQNWCSFTCILPEGLVKHRSFLTVSTHLNQCGNSSAIVSQLYWQSGMVCCLSVFVLWRGVIPT